MGFSRQEYWSGLPFPSPGDLPNPGIKPKSPALQADALTPEPAGKPLKYLFEPLFWGERGKNTGVGCHSLLQEIFLTQGLNPGLPHCRQTLYRLSHLGSRLHLYDILGKAKLNRKQISDCQMHRGFEGRGVETASLRLDCGGGSYQLCTFVKIHRLAPKRYDSFVCLVLFLRHSWFTMLC